MVKYFSFWLVFISIFADKEENRLVTCTFNSGNSFTLEVIPKWSPNGAERFLELVKDGVYDESALFRSQPNITVQFGIPPTKELRQKWNKKCCIDDDPKLPELFQQSHWPAGVISFAGGGKNSRGSQIFVTLTANIPGLGGELWETPFAKVTKGLEFWLNDVFYGYGDGPPWGKGPDQGTIMTKGHSYLKENFPKLSYLTKCEINIRPLGQKIMEITANQKSLDPYSVWRTCFLSGLFFLIFFCCCMNSSLANKDEETKSK